MAKTPEKTVVCLFWPGKSARPRYDIEWVNRLYRGVKRHLEPPFRFVCFTTVPKGLDKGIEVRDAKDLSFGREMTELWWKIGIMHPDAGLSGRCLFIDLDSVIVGDLTPFFEFDGKFCIIHNWIERRKQIFRRRPDIGNSSVYRFEAGGHPDAVEKFLQDPKTARNRKLFPTSQSYLTHAVGLENITWWPEEWVSSFKFHCLPMFPANWWRKPRIPEKSRIITFHGEPKPDNVLVGDIRHLRKRTLPMPELAQHWE